MNAASHMDFQGKQIQVNRQDETLKKNLRTSHFHLGQHPDLYETVNKGYGGFNHGAQNVQPLNPDLKKKLLGGSLDLGDKKLGTVFFKTTYQQFNGPKVAEVSGS